MANVSVLNMEGQEVGTIDLNDAIFGVEVNENLIHMAVVQHLANKRQGTQKAKTRGQTSARAHRRPRPAARSPEEAESPGDRRVPAMRVRVQPELPSGRAAALYSHPFPATIPSR